MHLIIKTTTNQDNSVWGGSTAGILAMHEQESLEYCSHAANSPSALTTMGSLGPQILSVYTESNMLMTHTTGKSNSRGETILRYAWHCIMTQQIKKGASTACQICYPTNPTCASKHPTKPACCKLSIRKACDLNVMGMSSPMTSGHLHKVHNAAIGMVRYKSLTDLSKSRYSFFSSLLCCVAEKLREPSGHLGIKACLYSCVKVTSGSSLMADSKNLANCINTWSSG